MSAKDFVSLSVFHEVKNTKNEILNFPGLGISVLILESAYLITLSKRLEIVSRLQAFNVAAVPRGRASLCRGW